MITKARQNTLAARRVVHKTVRDQAALARLFETIGPRFKERPGGYTRIIHVENRVGDNAPMSILELVEKSEKAEPEKKADKAEKKAASKETSDTSGEKKSKKKAKKAEEEKKD
jgi:large subunit ribosomal protein L17